MPCLFCHVTCVVEPMGPYLVGRLLVWTFCCRFLDVLTSSVDVWLSLLVMFDNSPYHYCSNHQVFFVHLLALLIL